MHTVHNGSILSGPVSDSRLTDNRPAFSNVILGKGNVFCFPKCLLSPEVERSLDEIKSEIKILILDFIGKVPSGEYIRLYGSFGLFANLTSHLSELCEIRMIEDWIDTPYEARMPLSINEFSDMDFQVSEEIDNGFLNEMLAVIDEYTRAINLKENCSVKRFSKSVNVPKKYVDKNRRVHGQPTVMLEVRTLELSFKNKNILSIDMIKGYSHSCLPSCVKKKMEFNGYSFYVRACPLEQLVSDMLWAFKNTAFIGIDRNKFYYRLKLIAMLIHSEGEGRRFDLSKEIRDAVEAIHSLGNISQLRRVERVGYPSHLLMTQPPLTEHKLWMNPLAPQPIALNHRQNVVYWHPSVTTRFSAQNTSTLRSCHRYLAQSHRFFPTNTKVRQQSEATQTEVTQQSEATQTEVTQQSEATQTETIQPSKAIKTEVLQQSLPTQSDIYSHGAVAAQKKAVHDCTFSHLGTVQKSHKEGLRSFGKIIDDACKNINSRQPRVTISITNDELLFLRRMWEEACMNYMPVEVPAKSGNYFLYSWLVPDISISKDKAKAGQIRRVESHPFTIPYKGVNGYRMRLQLYPDGFSEQYGKGTHISLFVCLMKGSSDKFLDWPFKHTLTFVLLDQSYTNKPKHIIDSIYPGTNRYHASFKRPGNTPNDAIGIAIFAEQSEVFDGNDKRYVSESDTAVFQLRVHTNEPDHS